MLNALKKNKHNNLTTLYYLAEKLIKREGIQSRSGEKSLKEDITFKNLINEGESDLGDGDA